MDVKLVRVIKTFGDFALINIEGRELKAKVEGKIPSNQFLGEISNKDGKVVIKVVDGAIISKGNEILANLGLRSTKSNVFALDVFKGILLPIRYDFFRLMEVYSLPPLILGLLIKAKNGEVRREELALVREVFNEYRKGNFIDDELEIFLNSLFFGSINDKRFLVLGLGEDEKEKWFGYVEYEDRSFRKLVLTTEIDGIAIYIVFEFLSNSYRLDIRFYGDITINPSASSYLKEKLEEIGVSPIFVNIAVGGDYEESGSSEI